MITIHILYPKTDDATFDMDYYTNNHMPMLAKAFGDSCTAWGASSTSGNWIAIGWAHISSQEALDATLAEHGASFMADVPNYTNVQPDLVIGKIAHA